MTPQTVTGWWLFAAVIVDHNNILYQWVIGHIHTNICKRLKTPQCGHYYTESLFTHANRKFDESCTTVDTQLSHCEAGGYDPCWFVHVVSHESNF